MSASNQPGADPSVDAAQAFAQQAGGADGFNYLMANEEQRAEFMANASSLQKDEWEQLSDTVISVRKQNLNLVNDLRSSGLTRPLDLSTLTSVWQTVDDVGDGAEVTMNPGTRTSTDDVQYKTDGVPLPVFHKDWFVDRRQLLASRNQGQGLDTVIPSQMTRAVSQIIEDTFLNGWSADVDGYELYGFRNHPDRNTVTAPGAWADGTTDPEDIRQTFISIIEAMENDEFSGPYNVYLSRSEWQTLRDQIAVFANGDTSGTNMRERIEDEFSEINSLNVSAQIPAGEAIAYQPTTETVSVGVAEDIQPVEWRSNDGWRHHFKILGAMTLELKSTSSGQMGVAHATGL